jgi:hypothetical protein
LPASCKICELRKPRRYCPGVKGDICSICCGNEREQTIDCPLNCPYLQEARHRERPPEMDPRKLPNQDIQVTKQFLRDHSEVVHYTTGIVFRSAIETSGAIDYDVRDALDSLIRTHRTLATGLYYDSRPSNPVAAAIYDKVREGQNGVRKMLVEKGRTPRDAEFLAALVHLQHQEFMINNGRRRGRAFIDVLVTMFPNYQAPRQTASPLIIA